jgi:hypothetical protein
MVCPVTASKPDKNRSTTPLKKKTDDHFPFQRVPGGLKDIRLPNVELIRAKEGAAPAQQEM